MGDWHVGFKITPGGLFHAHAVTPAASTAAPSASAALHAIDASGRYVITDWRPRGLVYTITPSGTSTPLFTDPNQYFSDLLGISRDRVGGSYFVVDDEIDSLSNLSSNGSAVTQISNSVSTPSAVYVADTVAGSPLTFTPAQGTVDGGIYAGVPLYSASRRSKRIRQLFPGKFSMNRLASNSRFLIAVLDRRK